MATLRGDESRLFELHHARLRREVAAYTRGDADLVEEACSFAWTQLLRRQPDRATVAGWLWKTAVHEVWRLERAERREQRAREPRPAYHLPVQSRQRWLEALDDLAALGPRQRRLLALQGAGHNYTEMSAITGDSWRTSIANSSARESGSLALG